MKYELLLPLRDAACLLSAGRRACPRGAECWGCQLVMKSYLPLALHQEPGDMQIPG